jgi:hypothetical protein
MRVVQHVAANLRVEQDGHDVQRRAGQGIGGGDRAEGVGEEQDRRAEHRRPEDRQGHIAPVLPGGRAEDRGRLAPFPLQTVERRHEDQHHQRDLEVEVGDRQAPETQDGEAKRAQIEPEQVHQQRRHQTRRTERRQESEGERDAGKIRGDAAEGGEDRPQETRHPPHHHSPGEEEAGYRAKQRRGETDLDADLVGAQDGRLVQPADIVEREAAVRRPERAEHQV